MFHLISRISLSVAFATAWAAMFALACMKDPTPMVQADDGKPRAIRTLKPTEAQLRAELTPLQYKVTQQDHTEAPFANPYHDEKRAGLYVDVTTGQPLFSSKDKFDSGTGWPSFTRPIDEAAIVRKVDATHGMERVEVRSKIGDAHLGHVFDDGPAPTGQRYCINSASLRFIPADKLAEHGYAPLASK